MSVKEYLSNPGFQREGLGLLITGSSRAERSATADNVMGHLEEAGHSCLSLTAFEIAAAYHFGQHQRLLRVDVLLINELGELSQAEQDAIDVINPIFSVTAILEIVLQERVADSKTTIVTTEYELSELECQFGPRLPSFLSEAGVTVRLGGHDGGLGADRS